MVQRWGSREGIVDCRTISIFDLDLKHRVNFAIRVQH